MMKKFRLFWIYAITEERAYNSIIIQISKASIVFFLEGEQIVQR